MTLFITGRIGRHDSRYPTTTSNKRSEGPDMRRQSESEDHTTIPIKDHTEFVSLVRKRFTSFSTTGWIQRVKFVLKIMIKGAEWNHMMRSMKTKNLAWRQKNDSTVHQNNASWAQRQRLDQYFCLTEQRTPIYRNTNLCSFYYRMELKNNNLHAAILKIILVMSSTFQFTRT